ncbi:MAG: hypothetical protein JO126_08370 [Alphaproteobacteria bacterium]|nr:hypothetical protein [Alphaproteobacteria bacterium]MBV8549455.1 hypothetical protein [Alphaproteobacteria bacterium]
MIKKPPAANDNPLQNVVAALFGTGPLKPISNANEGTGVMKRLADFLSGNNPKF